jgi:hypothetical protein
VSGWTGVVLAVRKPGDDGMHSRVSTYLHPLAGRPLCWHVLHALADADPPPRRLSIIGGGELSPELFADLEPEVRIVPPETLPLDPVADADADVLLVDAAAPALGTIVDDLLARDGPCAVGAAGRPPAAARLSAAEACGVLHARSQAPRWTESLPPLPRFDRDAALVVEDRLDFSKLEQRIRDDLVCGLMAAGTTFLLPNSVLVDVDVRIGRDTVIYPGVVLEGQTTIGEETVIGPGCRIIDSWIGSGVELKGWNYLSRTSIRNRAVLEPHVRRGL